MMIHKRQIHHVWTRLRPVSSWFLLVIALFFAVVYVFAARHNNFRMIELRQAVVQADRNNGDIEGALRDLREHVHSHMNTDLTPKEDSIRPPIQLKYEYERLLEAERKRVAAINEKVYSEAQAVCERRFPVGLSGSGRIPCIEQYVTEHGQKEQPIPDALYKFDFVHPRWSPDLAGWSLVLSLLFALLFSVRFALELWFRHQLRRHL